MKVCELERSLFDSFPKVDAESWDHVGLSVGDPDSTVGRVLVALDATADMVRRAHDAGANVLLAHHPVYIAAPDAFVPRAGSHPQAAAAVFEAARLGVSVLSFHTNLDRSQAAQELLPRLMGLEAQHSLEHPESPGSPGLGSIAAVPDRPALQELAERAAGAFDTAPRVWGDRDTPISSCAFLGGSLGDLGESALKCGADAIICGEAGYHVCQDLAARGVGLILLGHDASETPFTRILAEAATRAGVPSDSIQIADPPRQWWTIEGGRS